LERAVGVVKRALEIRESADLVLLVTEQRDEVGLHRLDLVRGRRLRLPARRVALTGLVAEVLLLLGLDRRTGLARDVTDDGERARAERDRIRPRVVIAWEQPVLGEHGGREASESEQGYDERRLGATGHSLPPSWIGEQFSPRTL